MMDSNFSFLSKHMTHELVIIQYAEKYLDSDPNGSATKSRTFTEMLVKRMYQAYHLQIPYTNNLASLLQNDDFTDFVGKEVISHLTRVRFCGNDSTHEHKATANQAFEALQSVYLVSAWFAISQGWVTKDQLPRFKKPIPHKVITLKEEEVKQAKEDKKALEDKIKQLEAKLLEQNNALAKQEVTSLATEEIAAIKERGRSSQSTLDLKEVSTRDIINSMLIEANWRLPQDNDPNVIDEFRIAEQYRNKSNHGYADFVLLGENGKVIGVIEAKSPKKDARAGKSQAQLYADGIEAKQGLRPVIFYSNGYETYIWFDNTEQTPRRLYGFYSQDDLEYALQKQIYRKPIANLSKNTEIANRAYQLSAVATVAEQFGRGLTIKDRKALLVLATGTGKTRVAISICDMLLRAGLAKRILFLCDRLALRNQAETRFREFLTNEPIALIDEKSASTQDARIYLATYNTMNNYFNRFSVGFFDLIISDESHRGIYNTYRSLFLYYDSFQLGLTATPVNFTHRHTFEFFECENGVPTFHYSYDQGVAEGFLCDYKNIENSTQFTRDGVKYHELTAKQKLEFEESFNLEEDASDEDKEKHNIEASHINKKIFLKSTCQQIMRNLMDNGIKSAVDGLVGKTIVFAQNNNHALTLKEVFDELYPELQARNFCTVITSKEEHSAEMFLPYFTGEKTDHNKDVRIAISVDMLDTGIDIPEIVNLVFAKSVRSYTKFLQMIGRGTRTCENLFGPDKHKEYFQIFDHHGNFNHFGERQTIAQPSRSRSTSERIMLKRIALAELFNSRDQKTDFDHVIALIKEDLIALPRNNICIKERLRDIDAILAANTLKIFKPQTIHTLKDIAYLMQYLPKNGHSQANDFDHLMTQYALEVEKGGSKTPKIADGIKELLSRLNPDICKTHFEQIKSLVETDALENAKFNELETIRNQLRDLMATLNRTDYTEYLNRIVIDIEENPDKIIYRECKYRAYGERTIDYAKCKDDFQTKLLPLFDQYALLDKIFTSDDQLSGDEIAQAMIIIEKDANIPLTEAYDFFPESKDNISKLLRAIFPRNPLEINKAFNTFIEAHPNLSATAMQAINMLKRQIIRNGFVAAEELTGVPFNSLSNAGLYDAFESDEITIKVMRNLVTPFLHNPTAN
ncbi:DEAD/DEAH box helicase family protein [Cysteiniphilum sp. QT6929]|uniref:DEAD/DEAH box helicase family protein n=1 Tax=Cysteiniphilum sp. QT6929 TaxID=2975055 RepID=UPI0024B3B02A|nr:DEAD/DEAH box helicase family protein [Cysteiniphilum sp. QT6929]WHN64967.1 DEAD/DEAH box helicase family protein [Cysteiniphilum sp. QT6929]